MMQLNKKFDQKKTNQYYEVIGHSYYFSCAYVKKKLGGSLTDHKRFFSALQLALILLCHVTLSDLALAEKQTCFVLFWSFCINIPQAHY